MKRLLLLGLVFYASLGIEVDARADVELRVGRFFDPCIETSPKIGQATGEACIIQAIFDAFDVDDNGITIDHLPANRDSYYPELISSYSAGRPPDLHILHRHRLSEFVSAGLLAPLGDDLATAGIDIADWAVAAIEAVTIGDRIFAVPFDLHANIWHINLGLMAEAGLVGEDGRAVLPASPGELLDHAWRIKEKTGKAYLAADFVQFPIGVRSVLSLLWQQGQNITDGDEATIDTAPMRAAVSTFTDLFDAALADPNHNYESAQQAFLNGEAAVLINGTWAVDLYDKEASHGEIALTDYDVANFPTLFDHSATWADYHLWVVPARLKEERPEAYRAALELLAWINDHNLDWARTGHVAVRNSILESRAYAVLAHRIDYRDSIGLGRDIPSINGYDSIQDILTKNLQAIWRNGMPVDEALSTAEADVRELLN